MVLITRGTTCPLCGEAILPDDAVVGFPAFLKATHVLANYSDAAFHKACFDKSPDAEKVAELYNRYRKVWESRPQSLKPGPETDAWAASAFSEFE